MRKRLHKLKTQAARAGFTLVEMLVATALVLLIMLLFASIYGAAVSTITEQRGLANVDSKARTVDSILRRDLEKMTFRQMTTAGTRGLVPLAPGDDVDPRQMGFFYISENDPNDPTDDTIHFTIYVGSSHRNPDNTPLTGKATPLAGSANEPDRDDGVAGNFSGMSPYAEVVYFLRGGNLYRRELLIRDPLDEPLNTSEYPAQPSATNPQRTEYWGNDDPSYPTLATTNYTTGSQLFYNDFDYAATRVADGLGGNYLRFLGAESLNNAAGPTVYPLAAPRYRYGFYPSVAQVNSGGLIAQPLEYDSSGNFIGRFVHAETSDNEFRYPGQYIDLTDSAANPLTLNSDYLISQIVDLPATTPPAPPPTPGPRQGADLLLQEVTQFDIEVWDTGYVEIDRDNADGDNNDDTGIEDDNNNGVRDQGLWLNLGHNESGSNPTLGHYHYGSRRLPGYGPQTAAENRVFDTWHPDIGTPPPFRPYLYDPTGATPWAQGAATSVGRLVFPDQATGNFAYVYRCVQGGIAGSKQPEWPRQHGAIVRENANTAQEVVWQCYDNRVGLEAIRITIRYRDIRSKLERQLTLYHSFVE
ncbi:MAG: prepilin-type N-terminal cleavage/methylation domain-containing protein [Planctomycetaceae bacterium]